MVAGLILCYSYSADVLEKKTMQTTADTGLPCRGSVMREGLLANLNK